jgi:glycine cleavage system H protein
MKFPENLKYTKDHEWILVENNIGTIGITEYAQGELGDVVFVDIDPNISEIKKGSLEPLRQLKLLVPLCTLQ